jgi:hypothetical protein
MIPTIAGFGNQNRPIEIKNRHKPREAKQKQSSTRTLCAPSCDIDLKHGAQTGQKPLRDAGEDSATG